MATPMLKRLAFRFGYDFTLRKLPQYALKSREMRVPRDMESEFIEMYERVRAKTLTSVESLYSLYQAVGHVVDNDIEGDFVECGVWRGGSCMLMALALAARGDTERRIYLYDTFTGMPEPGDFDVRLRDGTPQKERWKTFDRGDHNEWCYASFEEVGANMASTGYPAEQVVMVKGRRDRDHSAHRTRAHRTAAPRHRLVRVDRPRAARALPAARAPRRAHRRRLRRLRGISQGDRRILRRERGDDPAAPHRHVGEDRGQAELAAPGVARRDNAVHR